MPGVRAGQRFSRFVRISAVAAICAVTACETSKPNPCEALASSLTESLVDFTFGATGTQGPTTLRRWGSPIKFAIVGDRNRFVRDQIIQKQTKLSQATGVDISFFDDYSWNDAVTVRNMVASGLVNQIFFIVNGSASEFMEKHRASITMSTNSTNSWDNIERLLPNPNDWACATILGTANGLEISSAIATIATGVLPTEFWACMAGISLRPFGLVYQKADPRFTIFDDRAPEGTEFNAYDRLILQTYNSAKLKPGMSRGQAQILIKDEISSGLQSRNLCKS